MTREEKRKRRKLISERVPVCQALRLAQDAMKALRSARKKSGKAVTPELREQLDESRETLLKQRILSF